MTIWVASRANVRVFSSQKRPAVKSYTPEWVNQKPKEEEKEKKEEVAAAATITRKTTKTKLDLTVNTRDIQVDVAPPIDDLPSPKAMVPVSPSTPGYGTMVLYPTDAPDYIIEENSADFETLGGVVVQSILRASHRRVMSLKETS